MLQGDIINRVLLVFALMVVGQSCVVYNRQSIPIDDAIGQGRVKVVSTINERSVFVFKTCYFKDGMYYGIKGHKQTQLYPDQISAVYLKDVKRSKKTTLIVSLSFVAIPVLLISYTILMLQFNGS